MKSKPLSSFKISRFINEEAYGGILLIFATIVALIWANSSFYESYHYVWHEIEIGFAWGELKMISSLHHWINDGLMAIFFFLVGLEVKREVLTGHLSTRSQVVLPGIGALAGIVTPALIYFWFNRHESIAIQGWAIPSATDIAFALGIFSLFGSRLSLSLKLFLLSVTLNVFFDDKDNNILIYRSLNVSYISK